VADVLGMAIELGEAPGIRTVAPAATSASADGWLRSSWPATGADVHELVALRLAHTFAPGEAYVREGWQSWSTPILCRIGSGVRRLPSPSPPVCGRRHWLPQPPYTGDESHHVWRSETATAYLEGGAGVFVADGDGLLAIRAEPADGAHPDVLLAPRRVDPSELPARLPAVRPAAEAHAGWSTWDAYGTALTGDDLAADLRFAGHSMGDTIELVNVDDGWQAALGDWRPRDAAMARAIDAAAERHTLSLWWAPFLAEPHSRLAADHPDWILRDPSGRPICAIDRDDPWRAWTLDLTHPEVRGWLSETAEKLAGYGAKALKCDFLYAAELVGDAAREGSCWDPTQTGEQILRSAICDLRSTGLTLTACGSPLWPVIGQVEFMRVGPDVGRTWRTQPAPGIEPDDAGGSLCNAWTAAQRREWMHGGLWLNDPDSVYLDHGGLAPEQAAAWLDWVAERGLSLVLGDRLRVLDAGQLRRWERAVARQRAARAA
jgi:hypothetical protein